VCIDESTRRPARSHDFFVDGLKARSKWLRADHGPYGRWNINTARLRGVIAGKECRAIIFAPLRTTGSDFTHLFCLNCVMTRHTLDDDTTLHLLDASHVGEIRVSISPLKITGWASKIKNRFSKPMELSSAAIHEKSKKAGMHTVRSVHLFVFLVA
jgi:hypothetical protein